MIKMKQSFGYQSIIIWLSEGMFLVYIQVTSKFNRRHNKTKYAQFHIKK